MLVFINIEDCTLHTLHATHGPHTINCRRWPISSQDVVDVAHTDTSSLIAWKLDRNHSFLSSDQTTSRKGTLVIARDVGKGRAKSFLRIITRLLDQGPGSVSEKWKDIIVDLFKIRDDLISRSSNHILRLRHANSLQLDPSLWLDLFNQLLCLASVEGDCCSCGSSSCRSTWPMDVSLRLLGWFDLDDEVDIRNVKSSWRNISGNQDSELSFFESLHRHFSLVLRNVSMHNLDILLYLVRQNEGICISLGLREHDSLSGLSVDDKNIS